MKTHYAAMTLAALLTAFSAMARELTPDQALSRAIPAMRTKSLATGPDASPQLKLTLEKAGKATVYLFSYRDGAYLVLPADDAVKAPVLGFSDGCGEPNATVPPAMQWWLSQYSDEIATLAGQDTTDLVTPGEGPVGLAEIQPILTTSWNQTSPYNMLCPEVNGEPCPTGCVATAMAQVMKHWGYPAKGTGSHTYNPGYYVDGSLSLDFSTITYDWEKMTDTYSDASSEESKQAVATLMYSCGVAVNMNYSPMSSSSNYTYASEGLVKYFNYDKGIRDLSRNYFGIEDWTQLIYDELKAGRPILYGGNNDNGGHAFVCDGYRPDGYFHFNWGWGGYSNGYFLVTALNPTDQGVGGSVGGYNINQTIVVGIEPAKEGSEYRPVMEFLSDFAVERDSYTRSSGGDVEFYDSRSITNESMGTMSLQFGVRLTDESGKETYLGADTTVNLMKGGVIKEYKIPVEKFPSSGRYTVEPVVREATCSTWWPAFVKVNNVGKLILEATPEALIFTSEPKPGLTQNDLSVGTSVYAGRDCSITAILANTGSEEYYGEVTPVLISGSSEVGQADPIQVDLEAGDAALFEWVCAFPSYVMPGNYTLYLLDGSYHRIGKGVPVILKAAPTEEAAPYIAGVTIGGSDAMTSSESAPVLTDLASFNTTMTVGNTAGYFAEVVNGAVWYDESMGVEGLGGRFIGVDAGTTADITVSHDLSFLDPNHTYLLYVKGEKTGALGAPVYFRADPAAGITLVDAPERFTLFTDGQTLHVAAPVELSAVTIYDLSGVRILETTASDIDVSQYRRGVYLVTGRDATGGVYRSKLMLR